MEELDRLEPRTTWLSFAPAALVFLGAFAMLGLTATGVNWLIDPPTGPLSCAVKIRYRHQPAPALVEPTASGARVVFAEPQSAVTPGQAVVFYDGSRVLGGGWIAGV